MKRAAALLLALVLAVCAAPAASAAEEYGLGETWTVDGVMSLRILKVTEVAERNAFSTRRPAAVYIVDYAYTSLAPRDDLSAGLFLTIDDRITDSAGVKGYSYPGDYARRPQSAPPGAACHAQTCIGLDHAGAFRVEVTVDDAIGGKHTGVFRIDPSAPQPETADAAGGTEAEPYEGAFRIGEPWVVDGQWSLTVTGITATEERDPKSLQDPAAVYVIDYTYTNLGFTSPYSRGVYLTVDDCVVDSAGVMGCSYAGIVTTDPPEVPVGSRGTAQACVGVDHPGNVQLVVTAKDGTGVKRSAAFLLEVEPPVE